MAVFRKQTGSELLGLLLLACSILLILALVTYHPFDPSFNVSSPYSGYANYVGKVGAWLSDLLLQVLGWAAFCLPLPALAVGYKKIRGRPLDRPFLKLFGFCCTVMAMSAGLTLLSSSLTETGDFTQGGVAGILFSDLLLSYLNRPGSLIVAGTVLVLSLVLTTRFSVDATLIWIDNREWNFLPALRRGYRDWSKRLRDRKEVARLKGQTKTLVTQPLPRKVVLERPGKKSSPVAEEFDDGEVEGRPSIGLADSFTNALAQETERPVEGLLETPQTNFIDRPYRFPPLDFLQSSSEEDEIDEQGLIQRARKLTVKCAEFDVYGRVVQIHPGPVVTTFEFTPDPGVKYSRITNLADDLCLALKAESVRIDRIPGKNTVGIEVPNIQRQVICLKEILSASAFEQSRSKLTLGLGKLINGNIYITDLERMPHLLIAGATGSGKSVGLNCMVCSILYKSSPAEVRFLMIDPKRLELGIYEGIPHLLTPIVTNPKQAANVLNWAVHEMEERYRILAQHGVRNIGQYNRLVKDEAHRVEENEATPLPYILIIVDELSDLMMTAGREVEAALTRLAQMARAIGIHLILATQRPSVDVLTGLIKANFPSRISFGVSSKVDSRTILDCNGAEQLLGQGDMLVLSPGTSRLVRVHGAYLSEKEINKITRFLKQQAQPEYQEDILSIGAQKKKGFPDKSHLEDDLYEEAVRFVIETRKASTSLLQRRFRIGYGRAARLLDRMEQEDLIGPPDGSKAREVLGSANYFSEINKE